MGWEAVDDVFHAEPRGRHSPSQCELPPSYLECWQKLSRGSFRIRGPLTDPAYPLLHKIMYMSHLAADKVAPLGEGTQTVLRAWVCVI